MPPALARHPRALLVDAGGTLLRPAEPVARTYARLGARYGIGRTEDQIARAFPRALRAPRSGPGPRYVGDGRPFWRRLVAETTGSDDPDYFEALYRWYAEPSAWSVAPGATECLAAARARGLGVVLASNWDTRLRPLVAALGLEGAFDGLAISAEQGVEKPDPRFFVAACELAGVAPADALHVGDDPVEDVRGARQAGLQAWLFGADVRDFGALQRALSPGGAAAAAREVGALRPDG